MDIAQEIGMKENWDKAINFVLSWEGGYINDPDDPGGETKYGISKKAFPELDIKSLSKEEACEIYRKHYWNAMDCDSITYPADIIVFDTAVNMGVGRAKAFLELYTTWQDYLFRRIERYNDLAKHNPKFLRGWLNRVLALYKLVRR